MVKFAIIKDQKYHHRGLRCRRENGKLKRTPEFDEEGSGHRAEFGMDTFVAPPQSNFMYYFIDLRTVQEPHTFYNNGESERGEQNLQNH